MSGGVVQDPTTFIKGANILDVGNMSQKDFKLSFMAYKQGVCKFVITFKNEESKEYLFYNLEVTVTEPGLTEEIEIVSAIRESVGKTVSLQNPTD
jgi:hydrocephalus-inducing protein